MQCSPASVLTYWAFFLTIHLAGPKETELDLSCQPDNRDFLPRPGERIKKRGLNIEYSKIINTKCVSNKSRHVFDLDKSLFGPAQRVLQSKLYIQNSYVERVERE